MQPYRLIIPTKLKVKTTPPNIKEKHPYEVSLAPEKKPVKLYVSDELNPTNPSFIYKLNE